MAQDAIADKQIFIIGLKSQVKNKQQAIPEMTG